MGKLRKVVCERALGRLLPILASQRPDLLAWEERSRSAEAAWRTTRRTASSQTSEASAFEGSPSNVGPRELEGLLGAALDTSPGRDDDAPRRLLEQITSVSLFRLHAFRPSFSWERHASSILSEDFVRERVEGSEPDLFSGDTAFAAFTLDTDPTRLGVVVPDAYASLRASYVLTDAVLGLRNCVFLALRDNASLALLALVVVALPLPDLLHDDDIDPLANELALYAELFETLWENEQLAERMNLEHRSVRGENADVAEILHDLVPDQGAACEDSFLPVCAVLKGNATGVSGGYGKVVIQSVNWAFSPIFEAMATVRTLELVAFGLVPWSHRPDARCRANPPPFALFADRDVGEPAIKALRVIESIDAELTRCLTWIADGARARHQRDVLRRVTDAGLRFALARATREDPGSDRTRLELRLEDLWSIQMFSPNSGVDSPQAILTTFEELGRVIGEDPIRLWITRSARELQLDVQHESESVLQAFHYRDRTLADIDDDDDLPDFVRAMRVELSSQAQLLGWCRALQSILSWRTPTADVPLRLKSRRGVLTDASGRIVAAFTSLPLLRRDATITLTVCTSGRRPSTPPKHGDSGQDPRGRPAQEPIGVELRLESEGETITSAWFLAEAELPVAAVTRQYAQLTQQAQISTFQMVALSPFLIVEPALPNLLATPASTRPGRRWPSAGRTGPRVRNTVAGFEQLLAAVPDLAHAFRAVDGVALVPVPPHSDDVRQTLNDWSMGDGERVLLVAGYLGHCPRVHQDANSSLRTAAHATELSLLSAAPRRLIEMLFAVTRRLERQQRIAGYNDAMGLLSVFLHDAHGAVGDSEQSVRLLKRVAATYEAFLQNVDPATLREMVVALGRAVPSAMKRASRKLKGMACAREADPLVEVCAPRDYTFDLEESLSIDVPTSEGSAREVVVLMIENVIANAIVAATRARAERRVDRAWVRVRTLGPVLVVENASMQADAMNACDRIKGAPVRVVDKLGLQIICCVARRLGVVLRAPEQDGDRFVLYLTPMEVQS